MRRKSPKKKRKFTVLVTRISYAAQHIEVEAANAKEAKELASDQAGDYEYSEHDAEYEVGPVVLTSKFNK